jgi:hypothetical protein
MNGHVRVEMDITTLLEEVRAVLAHRHDRGDIIVVPSSYSEPVAFLATADGRNPHCVLLLNEGTNEVGRSCPAYVESRLALTGVIEGWQWRIECRDRGASAQDSRSTDGSIVLRDGTMLPAVEEMHARVGIRIGWDGSRPNEGAVSLNERDLIVNQYRTFVFGWVR